ncbi:MAG TPA: tol-pal system protein YbgF [Thermoanaerobaculia bacterium]|nr:tol-pal system protein YbgF [Thermoanaerobaculia bacterium]
MKQLGAVLLVALTVGLAGAGCQSSRKADDLSGEIYPPPSPVASGATDARLAELQTSMTELLERIDVLNDRMSRLESASAGAASASAPMPMPAPQPRLSEQQLSPMPAPPPAMVAPVVATPAPVPVAAASAPLVGARIADNYRGALELYGKNKFAEARKAFQQVLDSDAAGELADNALYWIGETYFAQNNFDEAMKFYQRVTKEYPDQNKAPDALYKIGVTHEKSGDLAMARKTFEECIQRYAYSSAAASARLELKRIKY